MYGSTGLVNQILLDGLAEWAVQAGKKPNKPILR